MNKFRCEPCGVYVSSQVLLDDHFKGKTHLKKMEKQEQLKKLGTHSVFLDNIKHSITVDTIRQTLSKFGHVERVILNKKSGKSAIVEFSDPNSVINLLAQKKIQIGNNKVNVKQRLLNFDRSENNEKQLTSEIQQNDVIKVIKEYATEDAGQLLRQIYEHYRRDSAHFIDNFVLKLTDFIQGFFAQQIQVFILGSTKTKMAIYDADVDISFVSKQSDQEETTNSNGDAADLLVHNANDLRSLKIPVNKFNCLPKTDKVKLLTRVLNEFRKETGLITLLNGVPDARCPVVRFTVLDAIKELPNEQLHFELSVNNYLGMHKSEFVTKALNQDLLLILFAVRLWGRCFKLYKDPEEPNGYWTSYALSLIFVNFCQLQNYVSEVKICGMETVGGWPVEYSVDQMPVTSCTLDVFLLKFYKFLASVFNQSTVLSVKNGRLYKLDEFKKEFEGKVADEFKFSLINIQDPIELTHNVTANVTQHYLKTLRSQSMRVICNLKADPSQPILALFAEKAKREASNSASPPQKRQKL